MHVKSQLSGKNCNLITPRALALSWWWDAKGNNIKGWSKGEAKPPGQALLGYCKATAGFLHTAAAHGKKGVSRQRGKDAGIIWFPTEYSLGKTKDTCYSHANHCWVRGRHINPHARLWSNKQQSEELLFWSLWQEKMFGARRDLWYLLQVPRLCAAKLTPCSFISPGSGTVDNLNLHQTKLWSLREATALTESWQEQICTKPKAWEHAMLN